MLVPGAVPPPGMPSVDELEIDAPLAWLFLREEPAPTGSAPEVIVGAELPCGYRAVYATVSPPVDPLRVRLRARFVEQGHGGGRQCSRRPVAVQFVSLQKLRLGTFTVTDATAHGLHDPPVPSVVLHVIADDERTPPRQVRQVRRCIPGQDASCTAGGVCGAIPGRTDVGVCVPPLDPYLVVGRPCPGPSAWTPFGTVAVTLTHRGSFATAAVPSDGLVRACLPACDDAHPCAPTLECTDVDGRRVCLPR